MSIPQTSITVSIGDTRLPSLKSLRLEQGIEADGSTTGVVVTDGKILFNGNCGRVVLYNAQGAVVRLLKGSSEAGSC